MIFHSLEMVFLTIRTVMSNMFKIDASNVAKAYGLSREQYDSFRNLMVNMVATRFVRDVKSLSGRELHKTRFEYQRSISMYNDGVGVAVVELNGVLPNMIENGASAFDQKRGFEKSNKKKQKVGGGWYLTIPFSHATPGTTGDFSTLGDDMPETVYEQAISLSANQGLKDDGDLPRLDPRKSVAAEGKIFDAYMRKHSPYEGMRKVTKKNHSSYVTFRRVSDSSDDNAWIHSGFEARKFFERAYDERRLLHEVDIARDIFISKL